MAEDRRIRIGEAAIRVLAREGLRGLTHRAVDRAAELPPGSTSYYVSTRSALIQLAATRLADRSRADIAALFGELRSRSTAGSTDGVTALATLLADFLRRMAAREEDQRARFALLIDIAERDAVQQILAAATPATPDALAAAAAAFREFGVELDGPQVSQLLRLVDALLFSLVTGGDDLDVEGILRSYLAARPLR